MTILDKNLLALRNRAPELTDLLAGVTPAARNALGIEILPARSGHLTAKHAKGWLHSRYDPITEANRTVAESLKGNETLVCIGLGLAYLAEQALAAGHEVLVIESDAAWLSCCLSVRDLSSILADPRLSMAICPDGETLLALLHHLQPARITPIENPLYTACFSESAASLRQALRRYQDKETINANTLRRFGRLWVRNIAKNLPLLGSCHGIETAANRFAGKPCLVLAAGPTLDEVLPFIHDIRQRCLLVCVDTALRSLLKVGIEPDFLVVVDPQFYNSWHLHYCPAASSILVSEAAVWPAVLRAPYRLRLLCASQYPLGQALEQRSGLRRGRLGAGGSVATSAWDFARLLGCSTIYMAGLDLSFPAKRTHARASLFEQRSLSAGNRLAPASQHLFAAALGGQPYLATANNGHQVMTDKRLALYAWWYTRTLAKYPDTATWNLSQTGLAIEGMPCTTVAELLKLAPIRQTLDNLLEDFCNSIETRPKPDADESRSLPLAAKEISAELDSIAVMAARAIRLCQTALGSLGPGAQPEPEQAASLPAIMQELDIIDQAVLQNSAKDIAGFLFADFEDIIGQKCRDWRESIEKTAELYQQLAASVHWHTELLSSSRE